MASNPAPTACTLAPDVPTTDDELTRLRQQLAVLVDRDEIEALLGSYLRAFEERHFDDVWVRSTFSDDVVVEFPPGAHRGRDGIGAFHREVADLWERTLHHTSDYVVGIDADRAVLQTKLLAAHVHRADDPGALFRIGGHIDGEARRTADGWRFRKLRLELVWTEGDPPSRVESET